MQVQRLFVFVSIAALGLISILIIGCDKGQQEASPPSAPPVAPPMQTQPQATAPTAPPTVVYASSEPQHGGVTQRMGDYMVELATGTEGKMDVYVQKHEGATPSFEDVQVEMDVNSKEQADPKEGEEEPEPNNVIFYPKDGKLQGTVAGLQKGAYDIGLKLVDMKNKTVSEHNFQNVNLDPVQTSMDPKHNGKVEVIDKTKMEVVREGNKVKIWLRDFNDKELKPSEAAINRFVVNLKDGAEEEVQTRIVDDHFEGEIKGEIDENVKILLTELKVAGENYAKLRVPHLVARLLGDLNDQGKNKKMTVSEAKKGAKKEMKGTIGTINVGPKPGADTKPATSGPSKGGNVSRAKKGATTGPETRSKKGGSASKAKKAQ